MTAKQSSPEASSIAGKYINADAMDLTIRLVTDPSGTIKDIRMLAASVLSQDETPASVKTPVSVKTPASVRIWNEIRLQQPDDGTGDGD